MPIFAISARSVRQFIKLGIAFLLSAAIGLEREVALKSAGLHTCTVVGITVALFYRFRSAVSLMF
jgi:putative Mg2+ transporter-C (MgtC) family protein